MQAVAEVLDNRSAAAMAAWAQRPGDNSFDAVTDLVSYTKKMRDSSSVVGAASEHLLFRSGGESNIPGEDAMYIEHDKLPGGRAELNNHSFNQACQLIGARAGEYKKYPAALTQMMLSWLAAHSGRKDSKILVTQDGPGMMCRGVNSPTYGRIWNHELAEAVNKYIDPEQWTVPESTAFHLKKGFITANDRKVFVFLVNEKNPITLRGLEKPLYRGVYAWNSEVGDGTCGIAEFMMNAACANRAITGITDFEELKIRHTVGAPDRWLREAVPKLNEYVNTSTEKVTALLEASRNKKVAKDEKGAISWLQERGFTKALATSAMESAREEERGADPSSSPYSVWNVIQGLTAEARNRPNNDDRVDIETRAGKLMKAVA